MSTIATVECALPSLKVLQVPALDAHRAKQLVLIILRFVIDERLPIPEWDDNDIPLIEDVIDDLENGAEPLSAFLWDPRERAVPSNAKWWSMTKSFVADAVFSYMQYMKGTLVFNTREDGWGLQGTWSGKKADVDEDDAAFLCSVFMFDDPKHPLFNLYRREGRQF